MGKTLTEPAATPYAEALLLCDNKQVEEDLLKIIELLDTIKQSKAKNIPCIIVKMSISTGVRVLK